MHHRMVVGATTSGVFLVAYVLAMEMVGPKFRLITFLSLSKTRPVREGFKNPNRGFVP